MTYLNRKDGGRGWRVGRKTIRFNSIKQIHDTLKQTYPNQNIITYYENEIFKDMLCIIDGENLGYGFFGEVWISLPTSCYSHLLSNDLKIKCDSCGKEHKLEDVSHLSEYGEKKLVVFHKKYQIKKCCEDIELVWNIIF